MTPRPAHVLRALALPIPALLALVLLALPAPASAQSREDGAGGGEEPVLTGGGGQLREAWPEDEPALHVAGDQSVVLEGDGETVGGRPGEPGAGDEPGQSGRPCLEGGEHECRLVEDADAA